MLQRKSFAAKNEPRICRSSEMRAVEGVRVKTALSEKNILDILNLPRNPPWNVNFRNPPLHCSINLIQIDEILAIITPILVKYPVIDLS